MQASVAIEGAGGYRDVDIVAGEKLGILWALCNDNADATFALSHGHHFGKQVLGVPSGESNEADVPSPATVHLYIAVSSVLLLVLMVMGTSAGSWLIGVQHRKHASAPHGAHGAQNLAAGAPSYCSGPRAVARFGRTPFAAFVALVALLIMCTTLLVKPATSDDTDGTGPLFATVFTTPASTSLREQALFYGFVAITSFLLLLGTSAPTSKFNIVRWVTEGRVKVCTWSFAGGDLVLVLVWLLSNVYYALVWNDHYSNVAFTAQRAGLVSGHLLEINLALQLLPITRNSIWCACFGVSFERAVKLHRRLGWYSFSSRASTSYRGTSSG
jgi:hypothetical protein